MVPDIEIQHLSVCFDTAQGPVYAVNDLSTTFRAGRISGVIGESGSGKSVMGMSLLRLLPNTARVTGKCFFGEDELYSMPLRRLRRLRGFLLDKVCQLLRRMFLKFHSENRRPDMIQQSVIQFIIIHQIDIHDIADDRNNFMHKLFQLLIIACQFFLGRDFLCVNHLAAKQLNRKILHFAFRNVDIKLLIDNPED